MTGTAPAARPNRDDGTLRGPLQAHLGHGVLSLSLREALTVRGGELVEQLGAAESLAVAHVALRRHNSLRVPVRVQVLDGESGVRVREALAVLGRELLDQAGLAEPLAVLEVALGRLDSLLLR